MVCINNIDDCLDVFGISFCRKIYTNVYYRVFKEFSSDGKCYYIDNKNILVLCSVIDSDVRFKFLNDLYKKVSLVLSVDNVSIHPDVYLSSVVVRGDRDGVARGVDVLFGVLRSAKESGAVVYMAKRDEFLISQSLRKRNISIVNSIVEGIDNQEMFLMFQPVISSVSGDVVGAEALIRWKSSKFGMVSPGVFIPLAEKTQFINNITQYVLKEFACKCSSLLSEYNVYISLNISAVILNSAGFARSLKKLCVEYGIQIEKVGVEITESSFFAESMIALEEVKKLNRYGFKVLIDDFGVGYSSLRQLNEIPVDVIKIDKQFIANIDRDDKKKSIVSTCVSLARQFDIKVLVEGVERFEEFEYVYSAGCDYIQGYYFYKPMRFDSLAKLLLKQESRKRV